MIDMTKAYQQGLIDGLAEGIDCLKQILEQGSSPDDVLEMYNGLVAQGYNAYSDMAELKKIEKDEVFVVPSDTTDILIMKGRM